MFIGTLVLGNTESYYVSNSGSCDPSWLGMLLKNTPQEIEVDVKSRGWYHEVYTVPVVNLAITVRVRLDAPP